MIVLKPQSKIGDESFDRASKVLQYERSICSEVCYFSYIFNDYSVLRMPYNIINNRLFFHYVILKILHYWGLFRCKDLELGLFSL